VSYDEDDAHVKRWDRITLYLLIAATFAAVLWAAAGCTVQQVAAPKPNPLKLCAQALVTLSVAADCTANAPNICMFTEGDMERVAEAAANKQAYCPRLQPGQEEANQ